MKPDKSFRQKYFLLIVLSIVSVGVVNAQSENAIKSNTLKSSGYAPVNGLNIYYEVHGEGEPIVLLHGAYMTINLNWGQIIPELAKTKKIIALELQGHGRTSDKGRPFSYAALADDVAGVMKYLNLDSADILGYSFGGTIAFQLAIQNPELVKKLIIVSTVFKYDGWLPEARDVFVSIEPEFLDNTPLKTEYDNIAPDPKQWHPFVTKFIKFDKEHFNLGEEKIKSIQSPTLLIMGDNDGVALEHKSEMYQLLGGDVFGDMAGLPKSHMAILPGTGHVSLMMETEKILALITTF